MIPGEIIVADVPAELPANSTLATRVIRVANTGDRPIQVGSHFHFYEVNAALQFERAEALGYRLNIPAGTAVRFEPGDTRDVEIVALSGNREVFGLNGKVNGKLP
jgi:urease subunit beta